LSRGKKLIAMSLLTFIILGFVGNRYSSHQGDAAGTKTGAISDYQGATGGDATSKDDPVSQVGINQRGNEACHLRL